MNDKGGGCHISLLFPDTNEEIVLSHADVSIQLGDGNHQIVSELRDVDVKMGGKDKDVTAKSGKQDVKSDANLSFQRGAEAEAILGLTAL